MTNSQRLATVRARLLRWLADEQDAVDTPAQGGNAILRESILIRDEFYCGRRFHTATHQAVWFIEEDELKIYRNGGELACVLSGDQLKIPSGVQQSAEILDHVQQAGSPDVIKLPSHGWPSGDPDGETRRAA